MTGTLCLGALVGAGPLATVHRGSLHGRAVAVKRARPDVPGAAIALYREARILNSVSHQAIVPVVDLIEDALTPTLILGWADGGTMGDLLADGPLSFSDLLGILYPLAEGLEALHVAGVAHLDVSVSNVLLAAVGPVLIDPAPAGAGTVGYADPVVVAGGPASARSDTFGLAALAHVALTGQVPRSCGGLALGLALAERVGEALAAGLDPDPRQRPASPLAFVDRLDAALTGMVSGQRGCQPTRAGDHEPPPSGRPMARASPWVAGQARTWPFDRWNDEAIAAEERRVAFEPARRDRRLSRRWRRRPWGYLPRSSAPDSTQHPPARHEGTP